MKPERKKEIEILTTLRTQTRNHEVNFIDFNNSLPTLFYDPLTVQDICFELEKNGYITLKRKWGRSREIDFIDEITSLTVKGSDYLRELKEKYSWRLHLKKFFNNPYVICVLCQILEFAIRLFLSYQLTKQLINSYTLDYFRYFSPFRELYRLRKGVF